MFRPIGTTMDIKDVVDKKELSVEERNQLIEELRKDPESFLSECSLDDICKNIKEIIEKQGLKNGEIAYAIMEDYDGIIDPDNYENGKWTEETRRRRELHNFWFLKAVELGCEAIDMDELWFEDENGEKEFDSFCLDYYSPLVKKAEAECFNSWGCRYALGLQEEVINYKYARQLFEKAKTKDAKISLYYIYSNGLGVKKNLKKANSYIKKFSSDTPLYAFKSNISDGIEIEKLEEVEQPKVEKKSRKPRKKNKVKSVFKKVLSIFK